LTFLNPGSVQIEEISGDDDNEDETNQSDADISHANDNSGETQGRGRGGVCAGVTVVARVSHASCHHHAIIFIPFLNAVRTMPML
jgi:hypothetical protein